MVDTAHVVYENTNGVTVDLFCTSFKWKVLFIGQEVHAKENKSMIVRSQNKTARYMEMTFTRTAAQAETLRGYFMPAAVRTDWGTFPLLKTVTLATGTVWTDTPIVVVDFEATLQVGSGGNHSCFLACQEVRG